MRHEARRHGVLRGMWYLSEGTMEDLIRAIKRRIKLG